MALVFKSVFDDPVAWTKRLQEHVPGLEVRVWPDVGRVEDVEYVLAWKPEPGDLKRYPNLKVILSLAAGVDHIFADPYLPKGVPVCRIVDPDLTAQMSEYAIYGVLHYHRRMAGYAEAQKQLKWTKLGRGNTANTSVGVMGIGQIGADTAKKLAALGFQVHGWSRTAKTVPGILCHHGEAGLKPFMAACQYLICVLPLTDATKGILNKKTLAMLPKGAYVINMARGLHVVDADLIAALDSGHVAGAMLDVFFPEPLPADHPYWTHPKVIVTPHIAGDPNPDTAGRQVGENINRARAGKALINEVNPDAAY